MINEIQFVEKNIENKGNQYQLRGLELEEYALAAEFITHQAPDGIELETTHYRLKKSFETGIYEILGVFLKPTSELVGLVGLWHMWRRYSGKSAEIDHMYIDAKHRGGLGGLFLDSVDDYLVKNNYHVVELNAYVQNSLAHKFYMNRGFQILGFHQVKKFK